MARVAIAGGNTPVGRALAARLAPRHQVLCLSPTLPAITSELSWWAADLTSVPDAEVALAGAETLVVVESGRPNHVVHSRADDLELLFADTLTRALASSRVRRVVLLSRGPTDVREAALRQSGVPLAVLRGGGAEPAAALAELVEAPQPHDQDLPSNAAAHHAGSSDAGVTSVQRFARPAGWSARDVAEAMMSWHGTLPGVSVERGPLSYAMRAGGVRMLVLRVAPGGPGRFSFEVVGGAAAKATLPPARFEVRERPGEVLVALTGFRPALPWPLYRISHAVVHGATMDRFGAWLSGQPPKALAAQPSR